MFSEVANTLREATRATSRQGGSHPMMPPLSTVLLGLPAGLALIIAVCGLATLRSRRQGARRPTQARGKMD
jgi:hypothetical protein